jgi:molybdenum cofactor cytidylyltransferase
MVSVVLGAGRSSRFGAPKQLLPFEDTTLPGGEERQRLKPDRVVLGRASEELRASVDFGPAVVVEYGTGCASSLLAGMDAAGKDREALMLLLGDQPGVRTEFIDFALSKWRQERLWASVTSYQGGLGNPFIVAREAFGDLRGLYGDKAVWKLIEAYPDLVLRVEIDAALPPEDYETALTRWRSGA